MNRAPLKPLYALADSRLLFALRPNGSPLLREFLNHAGVETACAAYIGASNDDSPKYYREIFQPAFEQAGVTDHRQIPSRPENVDADFLARANVIVLAGGSVERGWRTFKDNGWRYLLPKKYYDGALLIGISAGAIQLGRGGLDDAGSGTVATFGLLPAYLGVHDEPSYWNALRRVLTRAAPEARGIGIPSGGGLRYFAGEVEPLQRSLSEFSFVDGEWREDHVFPSDGASAPAENPAGTKAAGSASEIMPGEHGQRP